MKQNASFYFFPIAGVESRQVRYGVKYVAFRNGNVGIGMREITALVARSRVGISFSRHQYIHVDLILDLFSNHAHVQMILRMVLHVGEESDADHASEVESETENIQRY